MLVELKNGETLNGHLVNCDTYMNLTLKEVVQTSAEGDKFFRLAEAYVRGNNVCQTLWTTSALECAPVPIRLCGRLTTSQIKYLRLEDEIVDTIKDQQQSQQGQRGGRGGGQGRGDHGGRGDRGGRGGRGGRSRGRGGRGG